MWIDDRGSEVLQLPECQRLLAVAAKAHRYGHLGISQSDAPLVLPVDFAVHGPDVLIRVGENLFERMLGRLVAFEVDGTESGLEQGNNGSARAWSVLVRGPCHRRGRFVARWASAWTPGGRTWAPADPRTSGRRHGQAARPRYWFLNGPHRSLYR